MHILKVKKLHRNLITLKFTFAFHFLIWLTISMWRFGSNDVVVVVWKGIHSRYDTNRTGAKSLFFQAHPNRPDTGSGYGNRESGSIFTILRILFMICPFRSADAKSGVSLKFEVLYIFFFLDNFALIVKSLITVKSKLSALSLVYIIYISTI